jgi:hypothetical protein
MTLWVPLNVAKHIEEEGLGEGVEVGQGLAALGSEGFGLVQDGGDAALFVYWQYWQRRFGQVANLYVLDYSANA